MARGAARGRDLVAGGPTAGPSRDIAAHAAVSEPGPRQLVRGVIGVALGVGVGALAVALSDRPPRRADRSAPAAHPVR